METLLKIEYDLWLIVEDGPHVPITDVKVGTSEKCPYRAQEKIN